MLTVAESAFAFRLGSQRYQPDKPGEDSGSPIVGWITGNTYYHYDEHRVLIEGLVRVKT